MAVSSVGRVTPLMDRGVPVVGLLTLGNEGGVRVSCLVDMNAATDVSEEGASTLLFLVWVAVFIPWAVLRLAVELGCSTYVAGACL